MSEQVIDLFAALKRSLENHMTADKKPRRQKPEEKTPTTKAEFTVKAGKVQAKLNAIAANHSKATATATKRIDAKYKKLIGDELDGLLVDVVNLLVLPDFAVDNALQDLVEGEEFVEIGDDLNEELRDETLGCKAAQ